MSDFKWDGPEDSDEEIESLANLKVPWEEEQGIKFSKNGIIKFVEETIKSEAKAENPKW